MTTSLQNNIRQIQTALDTFKCTVPDYIEDSAPFTKLVSDWFDPLDQRVAELIDSIMKQEPNNEQGLATLCTISQHITEKRSTFLDAIEQTTQLSEMARTQKAWQRAHRYENHASRLLKGELNPFEFLQQGGDLDIKDHDNTPLVSSALQHLSISHGDEKDRYTILSRQLIQLGNCNAKDTRGRTPFIVAAQLQLHAMMQELLEVQVNIDARDHSEHTALQYAAWLGDSAGTRLLCKHHATQHLSSQEQAELLLSLVACTTHAAEKEERERYLSVFNILLTQGAIDPEMKGPEDVSTIELITNLDAHSPSEATKELLQRIASSKKSEVVFID